MDVREICALFKSSLNRLSFFLVKISDFQFNLPKELIAQHPVKNRDGSRLMILDRKNGTTRHGHFRDLPDILSPEDLLVLNNTKVFPARLFGRKESTGAMIEVLLLNEKSSGIWEALVRPARRVRPGTRLVFEKGILEANTKNGETPDRRILHFEYKGNFMNLLDRFGRIPLPPYIERDSTDSEPDDRNRYQTVYAKESRSVAAPTAGLHFTSSLLKRLNYCEVTLHVGYGTFKPVTAMEVEQHRMEEELYSVSQGTADLIEEHRRNGKRIIAVGTTSTRTLEHIFNEYGRVQRDEGWTGLYIYPGFQFGVIGGLITNFHLPGSTLLLLVSAFAGTELIREAYRKAVDEKYRFYSYGDSMLIL